MKKKIVFLTGAGVSKESGIDTFRDAGGLWEGHDVMDVASLTGWRKNKELVLEFYNKRRKQLDTVEPNDAHKMIAELEKDFNVSIVTQNVDNLHERGGSTDKTSTLPYDNDIKVGDKHEDGSQLRPFIVWFEEDVPLLTDGAIEVRSADVLVIVGTSLNVYPAASLIGYTKPKCDIYYIDPKPSMDNFFASGNFVVIEKVATEGMKELVEILKTKTNEETE
jgi:NAD-dependent deacetylase